MLLMKHIINGEDVVEHGSEAYVALEIQDRDPRKDYEWSNLDEIGKGGFATVYRGKRRAKAGRAPALGRMVSGDTVAPSATEGVAIKICHKVERKSSADRFKLWREVAVMRMVRSVTSSVANTIFLK